MSILTAKEIHCDGCSEWIRLDGSTVSEQWPILRKMGWTREGGRHYCKKCGLNGSWENHENKQNP